MDRKENTEQKMGLVFKHYPEPESIAKLKEEKSLRIDNGGQEHLIIEGENLIALKILTKNYSSMIDVICIDPPYNTGMDWLNYGDHELVDKDDIYPHSKWLSFMNNRLRLAYDLLSEEGVMFINIDEHETGTLLLLCHQVFGEENVDVLIWPKTDPRFDNNRIEKPFREIKIVNEYIFVCFKDRNNVKLNKITQPINVEGEYQYQLTTMETIVRGLGTTSSAKDEMKNIFGDRNIFQTPKPMLLIRELIRAASKPDSIVLDFFAGSGTTGHAVFDLNREDKGRRKFILINNNENDICRHITYARIKNIINDGNYDGNIRYYTIC